MHYGMHTVNSFYSSVVVSIISVSLIQFTNRQILIDEFVGAIFLINNLRCIQTSH